VLLPPATWRPAHQQVHVRLDHRLPADPAAAYGRVTGRAHNLELRLAGAGLVGDNLAVTLDAARSDALYAQVLFLLLGLPGAVVAALLARTAAAAAAERRRRDLVLLRARARRGGPRCGSRPSRPRSSRSRAASSASGSARSAAGSASGRRGSARRRATRWCGRVSRSPRAARSPR